MSSIKSKKLRVIPFLTLLLCACSKDGIKSNTPPMSSPSPANTPRTPLTSARPFPSSTLTPLPSQTFSENERRRWSAEAQNRVDDRRSIALTGWNARALNPGETAMSLEVAELFKQSINRLDMRYPHAVPKAHLVSREIEAMVRSFNIRNRLQGQLKINAALRFLGRAHDNFRYDQFQYIHSGGLDQDPNTRLSAVQTLSLTWAAINDAATFTSEEVREDRRWGLIESLAYIQRAHNEDQQGIVIFNINPAFDHHPYKDDNPSCASGTFKRLLENLDQCHPDIVITVPSDQEAGQLIYETHDSFFHSKTLEQQTQIRISFEAGPGAEFNQYREELKAYVHSLYPAITTRQLDEQTADIVLGMLFN